MTPDDIESRGCRANVCPAATPGLEPPSIKMQRARKITIVEMRESGFTRLIVYCADYKVSVALWPF